MPFLAAVQDFLLPKLLKTIFQRAEKVNVTPPECDVIFE